MPRANHYRFDQGADGELVYIDPDVSGTRQLVYRGHAHTGPQVTKRTSDIGVLASVTLETVPDAYTRFLTLLVPPVNVKPDEHVTHANTWAIVAKSRTTKNGPDGVEGRLSHTNCSIWPVPPPDKSPE